MKTLWMCRYIHPSVYKKVERVIAENAFYVHFIAESIYNINQIDCLTSTFLLYFLLFCIVYLFFLKVHRTFSNIGYTNTVYFLLLLCVTSAPVLHCLPFFISWFLTRGSGIWWYLLVFFGPHFDSFQTSSYLSPTSFKHWIHKYWINHLTK